MKIAIDFAKISKEIHFFLRGKDRQYFLFQFGCYQLCFFKQSFSLSRAINEFSSAVGGIRFPFDQIQFLHSSHQTGNVVRVSEHQFFQSRLTDGSLRKFVQPS